MNTKAYPGYILILPLENQGPINLGETEQNRKILKGTVIHVGEPVTTDFGKEITCSVATGQTVYFLSYADDYDNCEIDGKLYYFVSFKDIRGYEE